MYSLHGNLPYTAHTPWFSLPSWALTMCINLIPAASGLSCAVCGWLPETLLVVRHVTSAGGRTRHVDRSTNMYNFLYCSEPRRNLHNSFSSVVLKHCETRSLLCAAAELDTGFDPEPFQSILHPHICSLTPWSRVILGNAIVAKLVSKFQTFQWTQRKFITVFAWAGHWTLS